MTVNELILELGKVEDLNATVVFYYNDQDKTEVAFNVAGRAKPDAPEIQWIKETKGNVEVFVLS